jgi:hypothetical protein
MKNLCCYMVTLLPDLSGKRVVIMKNSMKKYL